MTFRTSSFTLLVFAASLSTGGSAAPPRDETVDFNYDIRPIISAKCFQCHGPDEKARKAKLRLDIREEAIRERDGIRAFVPGDPDESDAVIRIASTDPDEVMPPPKEGHPLTPGEIELVRKWVAQGAEYREHWAWAKPLRPPIPDTPSYGPVIRNPIDRFVTAKADRAGLRQSPEADRPTLIRRLSLDLIGLPPTPAEVDAFVTDQAPDFYERAVDRLLASPHYGEKWARLWLDLARYADSAGYGSDPFRLNIWPYRDWVINAFNRNVPYDQFTVEQLAGDLLPGATPEQISATAFHRNTMTNTEGGTNDEEWRVAAVKDRIATTSEVWMGLTMQCAQCHTHKFDPITHQEYYGFYGVFNQTEDSDRGDEEPKMPLPTADEAIRREKLNGEIARLEQQLKKPTIELEQEQQAWEPQAREPIAWSVIEPVELRSEAGTTLTRQEDGSIIASGGEPPADTYTIATRVPGGLTAFRLEALTDERLPARGPGRAANGNAIVTEVSATILRGEARPATGRFVRVELPGEKKLLHLAEVQVFSGDMNIARGGQASQSSTDFDGAAERAIDGKTDGEFFQSLSVTHTREEANPWWELDLGSEVSVGRIALWNRTDGGLGARTAGAKVTILNGERHPVAEFQLAAAPNPSAELKPGLTGETIAFAGATAAVSSPSGMVESAIDGDRSAKGGWVIAPEPGQPHAAVFETKAALPDGLLDFQIVQNRGEKHTLGRFRLSATSKPGPVRELPPTVKTIINTPAEARSPEERDALLAYFVPFSKAAAPVRKQIEENRKELAAIKPVDLPILRELAPEKRRETRVFNKGNYLSPGEKVDAVLPVAFTAGFQPNGPVNRLTAAQWIISPTNPLTARVAVNRYWSQLYGTGIVETEEDFGTQGALPTHPELLDWLAVGFQSPKSSDPERPGLGWDMKALLKLIVTSATYRQSALVQAEHGEKDPRNRLLTRYPRRRLEAEAVRDQALALSGLLSTKIGGPSVYPPQPDGLWNVAFNGAQNAWPTSKGEDRYRRGLYTFWRRTMPYPSMNTFDAPSREFCTLRRSPTNTPLQAFVTLNDPAFVECAQALARRIVTQGGTESLARARWALRLVLGRPPADEQAEQVAAAFARELASYEADPVAAAKMATEPLGPVPAGGNAAELAAWTVIANVLLNLDGVLTKG